MSVARHQIVTGAIGVVLLLLLLELAARMASSAFIMAPSEIVPQVPSALENGLARAVALTTARAIAGFFIASALGICLGTVMVMSRMVFNMAMPIVDFLRPIPSSALVTVVILSLGMSETSHLFIIVFGSVWPILFGTISGMRGMPSVRADVIKTVSMPGYTKIIKFTIPDAAPAIFNGMKVSLSISLLLAVTAELLIGSRFGIGSFMDLMQRAYRYPEMYVAILAIAAVGFVLNKAFEYFERRHPWLRYRLADKGEG